MSDLAQQNPREVEPYIDRLVELLRDDDTNTRINATAAVSRFAEVAPDAVAPHADCFVE